MNRNQEYKDWLAELEQTPPALQYTVARARAKTRRSRNRQRAVWLPVGSLVALFLAFFLLVNLSPRFAEACENVPVLRELARAFSLPDLEEAVASSPSLSAAVENDYVQLMDLEQSENGITMRIEYLILDERQVNVFYSLESDKYPELGIRADFQLKGEYAWVESATYGGHYDKGPLRRMVAGITYLDAMPDEMSVECSVYDLALFNRQPDVEVDGMIYAPTPVVLARFSFTLQFDPQLIRQPEVIEVNRDFVMDGQKLRITKVELFPTHTSVHYIEDPGNTVALAWMELYMVTEDGLRIESHENGVIGNDLWGGRRVNLESVYFQARGPLALYVTEAVWYDGAGPVALDLPGGRAERLPEGVALEQAVLRDDIWHIAFSAPREGGRSSQLFGSAYDKNGEQVFLYSHHSGGPDYLDAVTGETVNAPGRYFDHFSLRNYPHDTLYLSVCYTHSSIFSEPLEILLRPRDGSAPPETTGQRPQYEEVAIAGHYFSTAEQLIQLYDCKIGKEDMERLATLTDLEFLEFNHCEIEDISPLSALTNLHTLGVVGAQIEDISVLSSLTSLQWLSLSANQISDLSPLSALVNLKTLELWYNRITDITPLCGLTGLEVLNVGDNEIEVISSLRALTNLKQLDITNNRVRDITALSALTALGRLYLWGNSLPQSLIGNLQEALPGCEIFN